MFLKALGVAFAGLLAVAHPAEAADRGIAAVPQAEQGRRVGLVIGNDEYQSLPPLNNAARDARDIAAKLRSFGFDVLLETNASAKKFARALARFEDRLNGAEAGFVFYAGHGIQSEGKNYLVPSDAEIEYEEDLRFEAVDAGEFMETMDRAATPVNILVLDACRDNPLPRRSRSAARGLTAVAVPNGARGAAILYSAGPGETARDGAPGDNGVFTGALLAALDRPGRSVEQVFKDTARRVKEATGGRQTPWNNSSLTGDFYFMPPGSGAAGSALSASMELAFWNSIQDSSDGGDYCAYLEGYPDGTFAPLARRRAEQYSGTCAAALHGGSVPPAIEAKPAGEPRTYLELVKADPGVRDCENAAGDKNRLKGLDLGSDFGDLKKTAAAAVATCRKALDGHRNHPEIQYLLGRAMRAGGKDAEAVELYEKACRGNSMIGCNGLAVMYGGGRGIAKDDGKAADLYRRACDGGFAPGCTNLGILYDKGTGVPKNGGKAAEFLRRACDGGDAMGCNILGHKYRNGEGVAKDTGKATDLFRRACGGGLGAACYFLKKS